MRFWDTSAIVPLIAVEASSEGLRATTADDADITVWWATIVECTSALARRERSGSLQDDAELAFGTLALLASGWAEVPPSTAVRDRATRAARVHDLRAADALQLAAALVAADGDPSSLPFVTLDERLALAASREGFPVLP